MAILKKAKTKEEKKPAAHQPASVVSQRRGTATEATSKAALLIKQAWITEKAGDLSGLRKYIFIVDKKINKPEIKKAIESIYDVKVENVNVINIKGKSKRLGRSTGKTSAHKKAIVTLREGQKIDVMPT